MTKDVFVYHLDYELQKLFSFTRYEYNNLYECFRLATRVAYLISKNKILVPASHYFESDIAYKILNELKELGEIGAIELISSSSNLDEFLSKKESQHRGNIWLPKYHYSEYITGKKIILPGTIVQRKRSASKDIKTAWGSSIIESGTKDELIKLNKDTRQNSQLEEEIYTIPELLGEQAYISEYIIPFLSIEDGKKSKADTIINRFITKQYIASFLQEYNAICLRDIPYIDNQQILAEDIINNDSVSYNVIATKMKRTVHKGTNVLEYIKNCSTYELIEFKYSEKWKRMLDMNPNSEKTKKHMKERIEMNNDYSDVTIGVITALPEECAAMRKMMCDPREISFPDKGAGHRFFLGEIRSSKGKTHKVALSMCGQGNNMAAIRATNMLHHFSGIESIIMTGIAGGIPSYQSTDNAIRLGDIVVSNGVVQYDFVKNTPDGIKCRSNAQKPSARLLEAVDVMKTLEFDSITPWHDYIDSFALDKYFFKPDASTDQLYDLDGNLCQHIEDPNRTKYPKVFFAPIASSNALQKNAKERELLKQQFGTLAVEMEASGIADATWEQQVGYLVVRGVCDYCDTHKNDIWHNYAALVAAAYTRALIETLM